jgi:hypothetical protein
MDAREILESLDPEQISARLDEIDGERKALMTLLRAARHRQSYKEGLARAGDSIAKAITDQHEGEYQAVCRAGRQIAAELEAERGGQT